ncbi:MAG TPA: phosphoglycerate mutase family protein [Rhabdochlamydiaceae bacterium]|nr:phosphoglycerate mutase family protein [Rhabdochlamydiaceae bacterium]
MTVTTSTSFLDSKIPYYQIGWPKAFPSLPAGWMNTGRHIAGLALPFLGILYQPAGRAISFASTGLNSLSSAVQMYKSFHGQHLWSLVKNGTELAGTAAGLRTGLTLHTLLNLGENIYDLFTAETWRASRVNGHWNQYIEKLPWSQSGDKILPIVSNCLYLLTLVHFSKKVSLVITGTSLFFQGAWSLYKAYQSYQEAETRNIKFVDTMAHAALSAIFFTKAGTCYQQFMKIHHAVERIFVVSRPGSKHDKKTAEGGLTEKGQKLARTGMPVALEQICDANGKKRIVIFTSSTAHHLDTAKAITENFPRGANIVFIEEIHETKKPFWDALEKDARKLVPEKIAYDALPAEQKWVTSPDPEHGVESPAQVAARMDKAIRTILSQYPEGSELPVIITGGTAMTRFIEAEIRKNPAIPPKAARSIKDGGMRVVTMTPAENGDLHVTNVTAVDPRKIEMPAAATTA